MADPLSDKRRQKKKLTNSGTDLIREHEKVIKSGVASKDVLFVNVFIQTDYLPIQIVIVYITCSFDIHQTKNLKSTMITFEIFVRKIGQIHFKFSRARVKFINATSQRSKSFRVLI